MATTNQTPALGPDPEPLGTERFERLVQAVDDRFAEVDAMVGSSVVRWIEDSDLDLHEARALLAMTETGRPMSAAEVAEQSGLDLDSAYQAVHSLHGRGLTDEACREHSLTERGRDLMISFAHARRDGVTEYLARIGAKERRRLERVLRQEGELGQVSKPELRM